MRTRKKAPHGAFLLSGGAIPHSLSLRWHERVGQPYRNELQQDLAHFPQLDSTRSAQREFSTRNDDPQGRRLDLLPGNEQGHDEHLQIAPFLGTSSGSHLRSPTTKKQLQTCQSLPTLPKVACSPSYGAIFPPKQII